MPPRNLSPDATATRGRRPGIFHRESTRLRSNVADQVQRDLLPAGRMLSVFLILCELLAEVAVLVWSRGQSCDQPLRFWVQVLIVLQAGTVILSCLKIWQGRDTFGQHRNGLSATEIDMYTGAPASRTRSSSSSSSSPNNPPTTSNTQPSDLESHVNNDTLSSFVAPVVVDISSTAPDDSNDSHSRHRTDPTITQHSFHEIDTDTQPLLHSQSGDGHTTDRSTTNEDLYRHPSSSSPLPRSSSSNDSGSISRQISTGPRDPMSGSNSYVSFEFVDRYMRIVNALYLVWFIIGSVLVSDSSCSTTAPHLYRLIVALTIIYYALLFLPLACFCLIVCCLPLFILVYRIMLPYAERERRRARAADPIQVQNLDSIVYSPESFAAHTENANPEDANCVICLCEYETDEVVRFLPCKHHFHKDCVDVWLRLDKACCLCKQDIDSQQTDAATSPAPESLEPPIAETPTSPTSPTTHLAVV